ncbi:MAG: sigma 54-interacting transcriptional regulator [Thermodesulfobacteriota bacterium]
MKKKIFITLGVYSLISLLGGIYIIISIESSTSKLHNLIRLYQVETQRRLLLINLKNVQSDLNLRRTIHARSVDAIVANVESLENMSDICFQCHHSEQVANRLVKLGSGIEEYKDLISRVLTISANRERLLEEDERAYQTAQRLFEEVDDMVHIAAAKLSQKTERSINDISRAKLLLFLVVGITPFLAAVFGYFFMSGLTRPVKVLLEAIHQIESGRLDYRVTGLKDEFGEVAASFNDMAARMQKDASRIEAKTLELQHAHRELSTFCELLKKIGVQQSLDGVGAFLMTELGSILKSSFMTLCVYSSDRSTLFVLAAGGTIVINKPDLIQTASDVLDTIHGVAVLPAGALKPPLLSEKFPLNGQQAVIPLRLQGSIDGAFVVVCPPENPCDKTKLDLVALILEQAAGTIKRAVLQEEKIRALEGRMESQSEYVGIIGKDPKMQTIYRLIEDIAHTDATVLIQGETGTGKEMVARAICRQSPRRDKPFVVINCSAYPATLLESELFGHEKGAFTGAIRQKIGRFEQADGGTVFLDEIGEIPFPAQIKLLRVLQTQKFERIGGEQTVSVNVRILAATNRDLLREVKAGNFREDLYYRLNVIPVLLPPLRDRRNDVPLLAQFFQRKFLPEKNREAAGFGSAAMRRLLDYHWPGNVRELENTIEHAVVLSKGDRIEVSHLPATLLNDILVPSQSTTGNAQTIEESEKKLLKDVLNECNWNKSLAAQRLGIGRSTLYDKLKRYQLEKPGVL